MTLQIPHQPIKTAVKTIHQSNPTKKPKASPNQSNPNKIQFVHQITVPQTKFRSFKKS